MSEKPFWEGKTCKEMANLRVKVTYKNGDVLTGVTDDNGDIDYAFDLSDGSVDDKFIPRDFIESIELLDDPEYERIDDINAVREGDVYVATDGNKYTVTRRTTSNLQPLTVTVINTNFYPYRSYFGYALRPIPKLPDHDGLWFDKYGALWMFHDGAGCALCDEDGAWTIESPVLSRLREFAPFRPAKAVEA